MMARKTNPGPGSGIGGFLPLVGGTTPVTLAAGTTLARPLYFANGLQVVTSGTAGELDIDWY